MILIQPFGQCLLVSFSHSWLDKGLNLTKRVMMQPSVNVRLYLHSLLASSPQCQCALSAASPSRPC